MPVKVWLPPLLRDRSDAEEIVGEGETLHDVLTDLGEAGLRVMSSARDGGGELNVFVNGAPSHDWREKLEDGDEVVVVPRIRGGR